MANSLYNRLAYMKIILNSYYFSGFQNNKTTYEEKFLLMNRIKVIELRKTKIEKIIKNA